MRDLDLSNSLLLLLLSYSIQLLWFQQCYIPSVLYFITSFSVLYILQIFENAKWFSWQFVHLVLLKQSSSSLVVFGHTFHMLNVLSSSHCGVHISNISSTSRIRDVLFYLFKAVSNSHFIWNYEKPLDCAFFPSVDKITTHFYSE